MNPGKSLMIVFTLFFIISCGPKQESGANRKLLEQRIDSLEQQLALVRKQAAPRLSVMMNNLGLHHSRLWEPGVKQNWKLSGYEFSKVKESLEDIITLYGEQKHGNSTLKVELVALKSSIDSLDNAIKSQNKDIFVGSYKALTIKCNDCHQRAGLDFYEIISPKTPAYSADIE